ncbi:MAG TPA: MBL fold metallo-hydrolase [Candidatus Limnocylindria bacterium]|nr:MBL fold metallo-hydrolase [Candidatus Limnocylindria bacterium]
MSSVWREVGDRVWIRRYEALDQTIGVIGDPGGELLCVIDTRASHRLADELRAELSQLPGRVAAVVNTHGHWDHVFGNARFRDALIHGHVRCAEMITLHGEEQRQRLLERYSPETAEQFREVELVPPNTLVPDDGGSIGLNDRIIDLRYLGLGHTDNDIVALVRDADILFAGDLLENAPAPGFGDSYPLAWAETGRRLLGLVTGAVVPGHGDPFGPAFAERQVTELAALAELCRDAASGAIGMDEAIQRSPFPAEPTAEALQRALLEIQSE